MNTNKFENNVEWNQDTFSWHFSWPIHHLASVQCIMGLFYPGEIQAALDFGQNVAAYLLEQTFCR